VGFLNKQFGVVLPTYIYDQERARLAKLCFESLLKTEVNELGRVPLLLLMTRKGEIGFQYPELADYKNWLPIVIGDPAGINGVDGTLCYGTTMLFEMGVDYVTWMGDDSLFHPRWLVELKGVIERHPDALSWSCYRSANVKTHENLRTDEHGDVMVSSIGYGMTFPKREWFDSEISKQTDWTSPQGDTMDLWHAWKRPGERWVTKQSWIEHTGRFGVHCRPEVPEWAVDFQGIE